jgi:hypothetical protein
VFKPVPKIGKSLIIINAPFQRFIRWEVAIGLTIKEDKKTMAINIPIKYNRFFIFKNILINISPTERLTHVPREKVKIREINNNIISIVIAIFIAPFDYIFGKVYYPAGTSPFVIGTSTLITLLAYCPEVGGLSLQIGKRHGEVAGLTPL